MSADPAETTSAGTSSDLRVVQETISSGISSATPSEAQEPILKRRRVTRACQSCRSQKSKCDGKPPICGRCAGYGHDCTWPDDKKYRPQGRDGPSSKSIVSESPQSPSSSSTLYLAIQSYEKLIRNVRLDLSDSARAAVDLTLSYIRYQLPADILVPNVSSSVNAATAIPEPCSQDRGADESASRPRYLGEASDLRFFHTVRSILRGHDQSGSAADNDIQSYDHGTVQTETQRGDLHPDLPTKDLADRYIETYFYTIHIAYPFVSKPSFIERYERFWKGDVEVNESSSWLSLMFTILAIGAYYASFHRSENDEVQAHLQYFGQAMALSTSIMTDCSLDSIQMLLARCFFLLATAQTDRCWITLGLAIRMAQSIGLHVEDSLKQPLAEQEIMRRTWYSMYVLDRLLALQLGRPVAIHDEEYRVNIPSETKETACLFSGISDLCSPDEKPSSIDYFVSVITFSRIIGQVISDLYHPSQVAIDPDRMLQSTTTLDKKLVEWKLSLPRHLRFDLGHTFKRSVIFKRQRNVLAIKFHHLRTLMHRPYLCLAWLQRQNRRLMAFLKRARDRVEALERICVLEAQQTVHLLHNVVDEKSLVHDFPLWQIISCLLCASSVLLVSRACIEPNQADAEAQSQALDEDAETCLMVFDALSTNSDAARRARDMIKGLRRARILPKYPLTSSLQSPSMTGDSAGNGSETSLMENPANNTMDENFSYGVRQNMLAWPVWPGELSDPVAWSAQFIDPSQISQFSGNLVSGAQVPFYTQMNDHN